VRGYRPAKENNPMTTADEIRATTGAFITAFLSNDADEIAACMSDDWVYVAPNGITPKADIIGAIASGRLVHLSFETVGDERIAVHGGLVLVTAHRRSTGTWEGAPYATDEWRSEVYEKIGDRWLCVLLHRADAEPVEPLSGG
jgi:ketosteroid isomerase-like protein